MKIQAIITCITICATILASNVVGYAAIIDPVVTTQNGYIKMSEQANVNSLRDEFSIIGRGVAPGSYVMSNRSVPVNPWEDYLVFDIWWTSESMGGVDVLFYNERYGVMYERHLPQDENSPGFREVIFTTVAMSPGEYVVGVRNPKDSGVYMDFVAKGKWMSYHATSGFNLEPGSYIMDHNIYNVTPGVDNLFFEVYWDTESNHSSINLLALNKTTGNLYTFEVHESASTPGYRNAVLSTQFLSAGEYMVGFQNPYENSTNMNFKASFYWGAFPIN